MIVMDKLWKQIALDLFYFTTLSWVGVAAVVEDWHVHMYVRYKALEMDLCSCRAKQT